MTKKNMMVCVTQQKNCEKLIKKGVELKDKYDEMYIINVVKEHENFLYDQSDSEALEYLFSVARKADADLTVIRDDDVIKTLADYALKNNVGYIVLGVSPNIKDVENHPIVKELKKKLRKKSIEYIVV
ncbi:MAG: universal stress protein UspA [Andreesenia angusta]|nr:universal stress protein UspA [Andreesenia angusta]